MILHDATMRAIRGVPTTSPGEPYQISLLDGEVGAFFADGCNPAFNVGARAFGAVAHLQAFNEILNLGYRDCFRRAAHAPVISSKVKTYVVNFVIKMNMLFK